MKHFYGDMIMYKLKLIMTPIIVVSVFIGFMTCHAQDDSLVENDGPLKIEQEREVFIQKFRRSGLNTTPGDARFLRLMILSSGAKHGVEIGSASGYGAIHMGLALEENRGHLYTMDIDPGMIKKCQKNILEMKLENVVTCLEGDALKIIPTLDDGVDFVFIDAAKSEYFDYFKLLEPKMKKGTMIVADNVIKFSLAMSDFLIYIRDDPKYDVVFIRASLEKNDGLAVIHKRE
jgi:predicted O-methyltransferase YrrM